MIIEHRGQRPHIHPTAVIAPSAVVCGNVTIGEHCRVLHGAVVTAEDGAVEVGHHSVVMENALVKGRADYPARVGNHVLVGPHAHLNGCDVEDGSFIATGATVFPEALVGAGSEVRANAVVQIHTRLAPQSVVPIGWVAVGDPAQLHSPGEHEDFWQVQRDEGSPSTVHAGGRDTPMEELMQRQVDFYEPHAQDKVLED